MDNIQPIQITTKNNSEFPDFIINNEINDDCEIIMKEKQYKTFKHLYQQIRFALIQISQKIFHSINTN